MPNHVTNWIHVEGPENEVQEFLRKVQNDEYGIGSIDFEKVMPMPASLKIESGSNTDRGLKEYKAFVEIYQLGHESASKEDLLHIPHTSEAAFLAMRKDITHEVWALGRTAFQNQLKYGSPTWYEWSIKNWGTKWNAYGYDSPPHKDNSIFMLTAWSAPHGILVALASQNPSLTFTHKWADEDIGQNCGENVYKNGTLRETYYPEYGREAVEYAAEIMDADPSEWGLVLNSDGTDYIYSPENETEGMDLG